MAVPGSVHARLFYRAARERFKDAEFLLEQRRMTGAVYLAGYSVECMMKALILSVVPASEQEPMLRSFVGRRGHELGWLRKVYEQRSGTSVPARLSANFRRASSWTTEMRYSPARFDNDEAKTFLNAVSEIIAWADGRL